QKLKNNTHGEGYQGVAEDGEEVGADGNAGLFLSGLSGGLGHQGVKTTGQPTKIEPGEDGADGEARGEDRAAREQRSNAGEASDQEGEPGDAALGDGSDGASMRRIDRIRLRVQGRDSRALLRCLSGRSRILSRLRARILSCPPTSILLRQATDYFADAACKSDAPEDQGKQPARVQPVVEEVAKRATHQHRSDDRERQFERKRFRGGVFHLLL